MNQFEGLETTFFINIKEFGAVGDGIADDTNVIQDALNIAKSKGNVNILFPAGKYKVIRKLIIYKNTYLKLSDSATILRAHNASIMQNGLNGSMYKGYNGEGNILIEGGVFDGNLLDYDYECSGFSLSHAENITFNGVTIKDIYAGHAMDLSGTRNVLIENCSFIGYRDRPDQSRNYAEAIQIDIQTSGGFPAFGEHDNTVTRDVTVQNCYFGASGTPNTKSWGCAVGHHAAVKDIFPSNIKILYNTFEECTYRAIRVFKFRDVLIEGNTFKDCFGSINVGASSNDSQAGDTILINNNIFDGVTGNVSPISINGVIGALTKNVKIINNTFKNLSNVSGGAIYLNYSKSVFVCYNHFFDISRALWIQNSENVTFESNKTDVASLELVYAQSTKNFNCISNIVKETKRIGINLDGINGGNVRNNLIENSGTESSNTRSGIFIGSGSSNIKVMENIVLKSSNFYGIQVTITCSNIQLTNNDVDGMTGKVLLPSEAGFDGMYLTSENGSKYKVTVSNSGQVNVSLVQ